MEGLIIAREVDDKTRYAVSAVPGLETMAFEIKFLLRPGLGPEPATEQYRNVIKINKGFVADYGSRYEAEELGHLEERLFNEVGPEVRRRGHFTRDEFLQVIRWKNNRGKRWAERATADEVEGCTTVALSVKDPWSWRVLGLLPGVGHPVATALLAVAQPDQYTVQDARAEGTLRLAGKLGAEVPSYTEYLDICRGLATGLGVSLRDLDRVLWKYSKDNLSLDGTSKGG